MLARLHSIALAGIDALPCEIEVHVTKKGFKGPTIVGLPDTAVKESVHRIRAALNNCGYPFPRSTSVVSLAPADLKKEGPSFDLPIALGLIFADAEMQTALQDQFVIMGELALDGRVREIKGALAAALLTKQRGLRGVLLPQINAREAAVVKDLAVIPVATLKEAVGFLAGKLDIEPATVDIESVLASAGRYDVDFVDVRGQEHVKRALTVAAAGAHNILFIGPPGSGKTMLSRRLPTILPPLSLSESLETTRIYSAAGKLAADTPLLVRRPVRAPHHTASAAAMVGGGSIPQAGEVSLAHHGILFLDEFPEFMRSILETLRQPLEEGFVTIARAHSSIRFPARFMLVAAMNPCPCGYFGDARKPCQCNPVQIERYLGRISGPLIDRIDIHVEVSGVPYGELRGEREGTGSDRMRETVLAARRIQQERFQDDRTLNSAMSGRALRRHCRLDGDCEALLQQAMNQLGLSARAHDKILRVARTIADIASAADIRTEHVSEAIHYRRLDRRM